MVSLLFLLAVGGRIDVQGEDEKREKKRSSSLEGTRVFYSHKDPKAKQIIHFFYSLGLDPLLSSCFQ